MDPLSIGEIEGKLTRTLEKLFRNDRYLFEADVNERSISHMFAFYLKQEFINWDIDCEYKRIGKNSIKRLRELGMSSGCFEKNELIEDTNGNTVFPDIIVHHRGKAENLLVIEIKKSTSRLCEEFDKMKLKEFCKQLKYRNAVFIKFKTGQKGADLDVMEWICRDGSIVLMNNNDHSNIK